MRCAAGVVMCVAALACAATLGACTRSDTGAQSPEPPPVVPAKIEVQEGASLLLVGTADPAPDVNVAVVHVEVSSTAAARARGLSGREALDEDRGMLFVYADSAPRRFWMKDCLIALDIAFLDEDGHIVELATLPPAPDAVGADVPFAVCSEPTLYVLEVPAHRLAALGIGPGDVVDVRHVVRDVTAE